MAATKPRLPDPSSFKIPTVPVAGTELPLGTPIGLDLEAWAYAYINLAERDDRVSRMRRRLESRGYQVAEGYEVAGIPRCELWVLPRPLYVQQRTQQMESIRQAVYAGRVSDFAISTPKVDYRAPRR